MIRILTLAWAVVLLLAGPLNIVLTKSLVAKRPPTRSQAYVSTVRGLSIIGLVTLLIDLVGNRIGLHSLTALPPTRTSLMWTVGTLVGCLAISFSVLLIRKVLRFPLVPLVVLLLPRTLAERVAFVGVSLMAGLVEEYVFRGFCLGLLTAATASELLAFLLVTVSFGVGHGYQDFLGIVRATLLGAILAVPVLVTHGLFPSIAAHTVVDLTAGLPSYYSLLRHWGLVPVEASQT